MAPVPSAIPPSDWGVCQFLIPHDLGQCVTASLELAVVVNSTWYLVTSEATYLGHVFSKSGMAPDKCKVKAFQVIVSNRRRGLYGLYNREARGRAATEGRALI